MSNGIGKMKLDSRLQRESRGIWSIVERLAGMDEPELRKESRQIRRLGVHTHLNTGRLRPHVCSQQVDRARDALSRQLVTDDTGQAGRNHC